MLRNLFNNQWTWFILLFPVLFIPTFLFVMGNIRSAKEAENALKFEQRQSNIKAEVQRRNAEKQVSNNPNTVNLSTKSVDSSTAHISDRTETTGSVNIQNASHTPESNIITDGPHKGMTTQELEQHLDLKERKKALSKRMLKHSDNVIAFANSKLTDSRNERALILSFFKNMTPEQIKDARKEALKSLPAADVNDFFDDLSDHPTAKSKEQIINEGNKLLASGEAAKLIRRELDIEGESIRQEYIDIYGEAEFERRMQQMKEKYQKNN